MTRIIGIITVLIGGLLLAGGCATSPRLAWHCQRPHLHVRAGGFSVPFPVSAEVGGRIVSDSDESVTFHDNWGSRITFSSRPFNDPSSMMTVLRAQGPEQALSQFAKSVYDDTITVHYHPEACGGAISFVCLKPVAPESGVAAFVHGNRVYFVETDMLPGVQLLAQNDESSRLDRDAWLEDRAVALAKSMTVK